VKPKHGNLGAIRIGSATAVEKQLDQLETLLNTFIVMVLIVLVASANANKELELLGAKIETNGAYGVVVSIFAFVFLGLTHICWKIGDLIDSCDDPEANRAVVTLFTHKWMLNPFVYTGPHPASIANCALGAALLVLSWWLGLASLALLSGITTSPPAKDLTNTFLRYLYMGLGLTSLLAICRVFKVVFARIGSERSGDERCLRSSLTWAVFAKCLCSLVAGSIGWYLYYAFAHVGM